MMTAETSISASCASSIQVKTQGQTKRQVSSAEVSDDDDDERRMKMSHLKLRPQTQKSVLEYS